MNNNIVMYDEESQIKEIKQKLGVSIDADYIYVVSQTEYPLEMDEKEMQKTVMECNKFLTVIECIFKENYIYIILLKEDKYEYEENELPILIQNDKYYAGYEIGTYRYNAPLSCYYDKYQNEIGYKSILRDLYLLTDKDGLLYSTKEYSNFDIILIKSIEKNTFYDKMYILFKTKEDINE